MRPSRSDRRRALTMVGAPLLAVLVAASPVAAGDWSVPVEVFEGNNVAAVVFDAAGNYHGAFAPTTISGHFGIQYVESGSHQWVVRKGAVDPFVPEIAIAYEPDH